MDAQELAEQDARLERDEDVIAILQDAIPQLESLFTISHVIGHGTFSSVYFARTKHTTTINGRHHFAIKHIIPTSHPSRVFMELKCLKMIGGADNVMGVTMCFREMNHIVIVMPHFPHDSFPDYVGSLTTTELQDYMRNLFIALRRVHSFRIIHRDVKPANFLYNRKHQRYSLVDFGLAQEVSSHRNSEYCSTGKYNSGKGGGATQHLSPPILDTPLSSNKNVKRKLTVCSQSKSEIEKKKRSRHFSPPPQASGGVLSATTNRVNTALRRSPRKQSALAVSPKKENLVNPRKTQHGSNLLQDSPSKHTRNAEAGHKTWNPKEHGHKTPDQILKKSQEASRGLRRSPRKSCSSALVTPLEGLAKYLQDATALDASLKTPTMKTESSKLDGTVSADSSFASHSFSQLQQQPYAATCSPRVSGIADHSRHNQKSNPVKSGVVLQEVQTKSGLVLKPVSCQCYGHSRVCGVCTARNAQHAPRAGTPGFRAPEVLLRHPDQGTAVDMWSVGVILLCLLSGRYPFFRATDDFSTLAEISTLLGSYSIRKAAAKFGKLFTCSEERGPLDLMKICEILRNNTLRKDGDIPEESKPKGELCNGCHQTEVCVCLATTLKLVGSAQAKKKRMSTLETNLLKNQHQKRVSASSKVDRSSPVEKLASVSVTQKTPLLNSSSLQVPGSSDSCVSSSQPGDMQFCSSEQTKSQGLDKSPTSSKSPSSSKGVTYPTSVYHLLLRLLDPDPEARITAQEALNHPFLNPPSV